MSLVYLPCIAGTLTFGPGRDVHWSNVVLLLHGEGTNGSTTITDSSSSPKSTTASGSTVISTAQAKFGSASIYGGVSSGYFTTTGTSAFTMAADFTLEAWLYGGGNDTVFYAGNSTDGLYAYSGQFTRRAASVNTNIVAITTNLSVAWHHWAISRTSGTISTYVDGTRIATASDSSSMDFQTLICGKYVPNNNLHWNGYYDEFRITKAVGRYSGATISVPTRKFPES